MPDDFSIPAEFWGTLSEAECHSIFTSSVLSQDLLNRIWRITGWQSPIPRAPYKVMFRRSDVERIKLQNAP